MAVLRRPAPPSRSRALAASLACGLAVALAAACFVNVSGGRNNLRSPFDADGRDASAVVRHVGRNWKHGQGGVRKGSNIVSTSGFAGRTKKQKKKPDEKQEEPDRHTSSPVMYNGKEVAQLNGTLSEYKVDIWSGAHPVWQGKKGKVLLDASSVVKFQQRFGHLSDVYGTAGLEQLKQNEKLKKEIEERKKQGLKLY
eukprot:TRINITY_DN5385_c0_g4_i1.p2 TRINITY_DN5385_c0_g4~~TRINITY_DN5385_c0_g4_i1.p2  ORF type:complete len:197 (+),score=68.45 TRINITY_DN5385_c0_g4_i1:453-1043(+)